MADPVEVQTQALERAQLNKVASGDFRVVKFFENLAKDVSETLPDAAMGAMEAAEQAQQDASDASAAASNAQAAADNAQTSADNAQGDASNALTQVGTIAAARFVVIGLSGALSNERVLTQGANITINDGGANGNVTINLSQNPTIEDGQGNVAIEVSDNGTASQLGFFGATPVLKPTTAISGATFAANAGIPVLDGSTFGGYTIGQIVAALRALGILA